MIRVAPQFPPLIKGMAAGPANPLTIATAEAQRGTDAGLLVWSLTDDRMRAALVLAPETPLSHAASALVACGVGLQNALGVLVPPETAVHLEWAGGIPAERRSRGRNAAVFQHPGPRRDSRLADRLTRADHASARQSRDRARRNPRLDRP